MKAQIINHFGDPFVFKLMNVATPTLMTGHVIIKVHATSVNPIDSKVRSGMVPDIAPEFPAILHGDVSGTIVEVGEGVNDFVAGDEIYGCAGGFKGLGGALAEYMLADAKLIAKKPSNLSLTDAASLPLVSITAWEALFDKAKLTANTTILIYGGLGGVGHIALQLAKWVGAKACVTVRSIEDIARAKALGADEIINLTEEKVENYKTRLTGTAGFPIIFDTVGGKNLEQSFTAASLNGTIVTTNARITLDLTPMHAKGLSLHCVDMLLPMLTKHHREHHGEILQKVANIVDQNQLKPLIHPEQFTLETITDAHILLESGMAKGKIIVRI